MKELLKQIIRLTKSVHNPGLNVYTAVHANPKERNSPLTLRNKRVGTVRGIWQHK